MDYEITINYQFSAASADEARDKAGEYVATNLHVRSIPELAITPLAVAQRCGSFRRKKKEHLCVLLLDTQNRIIDKEIVSVGTLNSSVVHPREVFRSAISQSACSIIVVHNHPSGSLEPSAHDLLVTKRLSECGRVLGIELLDHVIVTATAHISLREGNLL